MTILMRHLQKELDALKRRVLTLCAEVEKRLDMAVRAVGERDVELADQVIAGDVAIDEAELDIEEECLKILALHQPVAVDLRMIVSILKMNAELERMGDLAVNIAERAVDLFRAGDQAVRYDFAPMAARVLGMLRRGVDALVDTDVNKAFSVCAEDSEVDAMHRDVFAYVSGQIRKNVGSVESWMGLISVSRNFERIADHATNIAEDVVYLVTGDIVRHHVAEFSSGAQTGHQEGT